MFELLGLSQEEIKQTLPAGTESAFLTTGKGEDKDDIKALRAIRIRRKEAILECTMAKHTPLNKSITPSG